MSPRQHAHFAFDLANLVELAPIRTPLSLQHLIAEDPFLQRVKQLLALSLLLFRQRLDRLLLSRIDARVAFQLLVLLGIHRVLQLHLSRSRNLIVQRLIHFRRLVLFLRLAAFLRQLANPRRNLLAAVMPELNRRQHVRLAHLLRAGLHHHDPFLGPRDNNIDARRLGLFVSGIRHQRPIHHADPHRRQHMLKRNIGNRQRGARAHNRQRRRIAHRIGRQHHADHLRLMRIPFGEQRPDRPVNQTAGENLFLGRPPFAFDKSSRETPRRVSVLAVIHRQREKIGVRFRLRRRTGGHQDHRLSGTDNHRSIGLLGHLSGFNRQNPATAKVHFNGMQHV